MGARVPVNRFVPAYTSVVPAEGVFALDDRWVVKLCLGDEFLVVLMCATHEKALMYEAMLCDALAEFADPRGPSDEVVAS